MALESEHVPPDVIRKLLSSAGTPSWRALHESAHQELERDSGPRFEENVLNDVVAVARGMEMDHVPFPADFEALVTEVNRRAKATPHR